MKKFLFLALSLVFLLGVFAVPQAVARGRCDGYRDKIQMLEGRINYCRKLLKEVQHSLKWGFMSQRRADKREKALSRELKAYSKMQRPLRRKLNDCKRQERLRQERQKRLRQERQKRHRPRDRQRRQRRHDRRR